MTIPLSFQQKIAGENGIFDVALTLALHQNRNEFHWKKLIVTGKQIGRAHV